MPREPHDRHARRSRVARGADGPPLLIAPVVLSFFAYRGWLQNKREEEQRREGDRMRTLYEAGGPSSVRDELRLPTVPQVGAATRRRVRAELAVRDEAGLRVYNSESLSDRSDRDRSGGPTAYVSTRRGSPAVAAVVTSPGRSGSSPSPRQGSLRRNARWPTRWLLRSPRGNGTRSSSTRRSSNVATWRTLSAAARMASSSYLGGHGALVEPGDGEDHRLPRGRGSRSSFGDVLRIPGGRARMDRPTELALGVVEPRMR
jgi:hypothetical protein